jgi:hypothetical protein
MKTIFMNAVRVIAAPRQGRGARMKALLVRLIFPSVYVGLYVAACIVREISPLLALPPLSVAFAVLSYWSPRYLRKRRDRFLAVMETADADALVRAERIGGTVGSLVGAVGVWAVVAAPAPWISHRILALADPGARFYYAQYPGLSTVLLIASSFAALTLVSNVVASLLAGPRRELWCRHAGRMSRRAVMWASGVIMVMSLALLPIFLAPGVSVTDKGIVLHELWPSQPSFHGWNDVRKVGHSDTLGCFYVVFTDGYIWAIQDSFWDLRDRGYGIAMYVEKRIGKPIE